MTVEDLIEKLLDLPITDWHLPVVFHVIDFDERIDRNETITEVKEGGKKGYPFVVLES